MKKLFIITVAFLTFSFQTIANAKSLDYAGIEDSISSFITKNASKVSWHFVNNFKVASFVKDSYRMKVYYDEQGDLVTITRVLKNRNELPKTALENIEKKYPGWGMTNLFEEKGLENNVAYYATMTDGEHSIILKINAFGKIRRF